VQLASVVARELQKGLATRTAMAKSDSSPVTVADFSVQVTTVIYNIHMNLLAVTLSACCYIASFVVLENVALTHCHAYMH
jgi:hypothetical protein